jgi:hypothetical protein
MELGTYVEELQRQLAAAAAAGDDGVRETAQRLTTALDAAARLMLLEALGAAAGEITTELAPGSVDVRLRGREPVFVVTPAPAPTSTEARAGEGPASTPPISASIANSSSAASSVSATVGGEEGGTTRTTLRLPDELKARVEEAAARAGVSVNTWLVRAVAATLDTSAPGAPGASRASARETRGDRVTGWVR